MTPKQIAEKIYADSLEIENRGTATHYRTLKLKELPEYHRYIVKSYLEQIGKRRSKEAAKRNNSGMGSV